MSKKVKSMFLFTGMSLMSIGVLNFLAEASEKIKEFLTVHQGLGPYSGKITYGAVIGVIIAVAYFLASKESQVDIKKWTIFVFLSLLLASLLVFTPFLHLVLDN